MLLLRLLEIDSLNLFFASGFVPNDYPDLLDSSVGQFEIPFWRDSVDLPVSSCELSDHLFWPFPVRQLAWVARNAPYLLTKYNFATSDNVFLLGEDFLEDRTPDPAEPQNFATVDYVQLFPSTLRMLAWLIRRYGVAEPAPFPF